MSEEQVSKVEEVMLAITETNALEIADPVRQSLVSDLQPVANQIAAYEAAAKTMEATDTESAKAITELCETIATDIKTVKNQEVLSKIVKGLHSMHRRWTTIRGTFLDPMEAARKTLKGKVMDWDDAEQAKADEIERKQQAEVDAKARREREALEKKAAAIKTPEKKEALLEQAAATVAPTVTVNAPKSGIRSQLKWAVKSVDTGVFLAAAASNPMMAGFIEIKENMLARSKASNPAFACAGVEFHQIRV